MANKRMFSMDIVSSDAFLDMPTSSRELYFQLGMYADDEGFVNPKKILRMTGAGDDDLKVLIGKRFILPFKSGVVVIKHWLIHNTIRMDRFNPTNYEQEKNSLFIKENRSYTDMATNGKPLGNQMATQVKLSKVKLSKDKLDTPYQKNKSWFNDPINKNKHSDFFSYWTEPNKSGSKGRWEEEHTFDVARRLATWQKNGNKWDKKTYETRPELTNWTAQRHQFEKDEQQRIEAQKKIDELKLKNPIGKSI